MAMKVTDELIITRPDDWHFHPRDGAGMKSVIGDTARRFARAIVMPNLKPPVANTVQAIAYRERILAALPKGSSFDPLMTLYLTDNTSPDEIDRAVDSGLVKAVKYYPAGATTNSDAGVTDMEKAYPAIRRMEERGLPLLLHSEVTDPTVDIFDREAKFIVDVFLELRKKFPALKIVLEHITTDFAVGHVFAQARDKHPTAATITAHHLLENRNAIFRGGLNPHNYCLPVLKREKHRQALLEAATSGNPHFFLGTDSAPHARNTKEAACGCAGCFTAPAAIELYAEAFDSVGKLDKLEGFASFYGADFYGLPRNMQTITLVREEWEIPQELPLGDGVVVPFWAGKKLQRKMK